MNYAAIWKIAKPLLKELGKLAVEKMARDNIERLRAREKRLESKYRRMLHASQSKRERAYMIYAKSEDARMTANEMEAE